MQPYRDFRVAVAIAFGLFIVAVTMIFAGRAPESPETPATARALRRGLPS